MIPNIVHSQFCLTKYCKLSSDKIHNHTVENTHRANIQLTGVQEKSKYQEIATHDGKKATFLDIFLVHEIP